MSFLLRVPASETSQWFLPPLILAPYPCVTERIAQGEGPRTLPLNTRPIPCCPRDGSAGEGLECNDLFLGFCVGCPFFPLLFIFIFFGGGVVVAPRRSPIFFCFFGFFVL